MLGLYYSICYIQSCASVVVLPGASVDKGYWMLDVAINYQKDGLSSFQNRYY